MAHLPVEDRSNIVGWVTPIVSAVVSRSREAVRLHEELAERSNEIDLLYGISDRLGDTVRLEETAKTILRDLCDALNARRGSIMVYEEGDDALRIVAHKGIHLPELEPVRLSGEHHSVSARVFRSGRTLSWNPELPRGDNPGTPQGRTYIGKAFMSVPIVYGAPGRARGPSGSSTSPTGWGRMASAPATGSWSRPWRARSVPPSPTRGSCSAT
ncbi:MAG TPA: GAF domain-containing protein [Gemmatimonadales bacterium]|nr:GAF domain-containing protein [Gemmatimonadales bacterium]